MISSIAWLPRGAANPVPSVADPPSKEEIEEMIKSGALEPRSVVLMAINWILLDFNPWFYF